MPEPTKYVAGFCFNEARDRVLLIKKNRPKWQNGRLNGIGGHVEASDEMEIRAMRREFLEETGIDSDHRGIGWKQMAILHGDRWIVLFYYAFSDAMNLAATHTDEEIVDIAVRDAMFDPRALPNVPMLLSMALMGGYTVKPIILFDNSPPNAYDY